MSNLIKYQLGANEVVLETNEAIADIPSNRTLMVQQLTDQAPTTPECVYGLETIDNVFNRFKPSVQLELVDAEGGEVKEKMDFKNLGDFGAKSIKQNSAFLSSLNLEKEQSTKIAQQLTNNKVLQKILENPETKNALIEVLKSAVDEINAAQTNVQN